MAIVMVSFLFFSCDSGPKVIEAQSDNSSKEAAPPISANPHNHPMTGSGEDEMHEVVAQEVLNTEKYSYVRVTEGEEEFWIAVGKRPIEIGETYYYKGGLLKKNFQSREFNRVFETVYLVSNLLTRPANAGSGSAVDQALTRLNGGPNTASSDIDPDDVTPAEGAIPIAELLKNKEKYNGKTIKVTGKCVKVNPMIMGRNWLHLIDASVEEGDLTITTQEAIPAGAVVTLEGTISLNKDFGAGYRYDIIMENAILK